jgi:hypothetical protein
VCDGSGLYLPRKHCRYICIDVLRNLGLTPRNFQDSNLTRVRVLREQQKEIDRVLGPGNGSIGMVFTINRARNLRPNQFRTATVLSMDRVQGNLLHGLR